MLAGCKPALTGSGACETPDHRAHVRGGSSELSAFRYLHRRHILKIYAEHLQIGFLACCLLFASAGPLICEPMQEVGTLANLQSFATSSNPISVLVEYRATFGDNGGGIFVWNPTSTATADNALVVMPNGHTGAGRWLRKYEGYVYPCWYGSPDSTGDDNLDLQAAMNSGLPVEIQPKLQYLFACQHKRQWTNRGFQWLLVKRYILRGGGCGFVDHRK